MSPHLPRQARCDTCGQIWPCPDSAARPPEEGRLGPARALLATWWALTDPAEFDIQPELEAQALQDAREIAAGARRDPCPLCVAAVAWWDRLMRPLVTAGLFEDPAWVRAIRATLPPETGGAPPPSP